MGENEVGVGGESGLKVNLAKKKDEGDPKSAKEDASNSPAVDPNGTASSGGDAASDDSAVNDDSSTDGTSTTAPSAPKPESKTKST